MVGDEPGYLSFLEDSRMDEIPDRTYANALALVLDCGGHTKASGARVPNRETAMAMLADLDEMMQ